MWYRNSKIALLKLGITRKKVKEYKERDEKKREEFREAIRNIPKENLVYVDESGVDQYLYLEYGRAPRGKKIPAKISGRKFERVSVVAAKCGHEVLAPIGYTGTCDTKFFNEWVQKSLIPELKPGQVVVMDNASIHKSSEVEKLLKQAGCRLLYLPPYSPDLNPIEHLWAEMKNTLRKIISNFSSLFDAIHYFFESKSFN